MERQVNLQLTRPLNITKAKWKFSFRRCVILPNKNLKWLSNRPSTISLSYSLSSSAATVIEKTKSSNSANDSIFELIFKMRKKYLIPSFMSHGPIAFKFNMGLPRDYWILTLIIQTENKFETISIYVLFNIIMPDFKRLKNLLLFAFSSSSRRPRAIEGQSLAKYFWTNNIWTIFQLGFK